MKDKGSLSVFLCIFLPVFILFLGTLVDISRMKITSNRLEESLYTSLDSLLTCYNRQGKEDYGLYVINKEEDTIFYEMMEANMGENLLKVELQYTDPLNNMEVLKNQVLEDIKVTGLINLGKDFMGKFEALKGIKEKTDFSDSGDNKEALAKNLQKEVEKNMLTIKDLEERKSNGERGLEELIEGLYSKNKELLITAEDISEGKNPPLEEEKKMQMDESLKRLQEMYGEDILSPSEPLDTFYESQEIVNEATALEQSFLNLRNSLLIGEYIVEHFEDMSHGGSGEIERILHGNNYEIPAVSELFMSQFLLDSIGYLTLDPKAPPEGVSRLIYAVLGGAVTGVCDTAELLLDENKEVPLVHIEPQGVSFLEKIPLSYKNHLQFSMLFKEDHKKLEGIYGIINEKMGDELYTGAVGKGSAYVDLFFLKFLPEGTPILDGEIKGGQFYVEKEVGKSY